MVGVVFCQRFCPFGALCPRALSLLLGHLHGCSSVSRNGNLFCDACAVSFWSVVWNILTWVLCYPSWVILTPLCFVVFQPFLGRFFGMSLLMFDVFVVKYVVFEAFIRSFWCVCLSASVLVSCLSCFVRSFGEYFSFLSSSVVGFYTVVCGHVFVISVLCLRHILRCFVQVLSFLLAMLSLLCHHVSRS